MTVTREQVKSMWEKFVFHNELDPDLPPMIRDSWLRSKKAMVDPFRPYGWIKEIDNEKYRSLIDWSLPLMEGLYSIVKGSGFLVILCNENGQLLLSIGDRDLTFEVKPWHETKVMGVDVGLRYIAVASVGTKSWFFKGNQCTFVRRRYAALRRTLGQAKKLHMIRKIGDKESRWMKDMNHKISRQIVRFALANGVGVIRMEILTGIRKRAASAKEAGRNLHSWAFHQLQTMIAYKAEMAGIRVEWVNATYTSQTCRCGHREKANRNGIHFRCQKCGYTIHADLNGAINIAKAISGFAA
ncbi:hypothetical protein BJQ97_02764 [Geobacillus sp. TFV-3]|nr:hypothetical protein BJQ97_02764 [Geobacillus sp. TFV-3]